MWVVIILAALAAALALILAIPLDLVSRLDVDGRPGFQARLTWFFGLLDKEIKGGRKRPYEKPAKESKERKGRGIRDIRSILQNKGLVGKFLNLIKEILSCIQVRQLDADFRLGLGDPAHTGLLFAFIYPVTFAFIPSLRRTISLRPDFDEAVCEGYLHAIIRLQPIRLIIPLSKFVFSRPALRLLQSQVFRKWKRKKPQ